MAPDKPWYRTLTRYQWLVLLIAWLGWVFDVMDTSLFNFAKTPMLHELLGSSTQPRIDGLFATVLLVGWSIGGLVFGVLADRWGRVHTLTLTVLIYCVFTGLTSACTTWQQVVIVRFITALGIGGEWAAGAALLAEAFPDKARAPGAALLQSAAAFGPWFASLINLGVPAAHWRWLFLVGILPALITVGLRMGVREPARWTAATAEDKPQPLRELFATNPWRRHAIVAIVLGVAGIAAATNISYWVPNLTNAVSAGLSADSVQHRISYVTLAMHCGTLVGVCLMPWLCERMGRKRALLAFLILSPISVGVATFSGGDYTRLLLLAPLMSLFTIGMSAGFVLYFPELFPTVLRATGSGLAYNSGRILAAAVPLATGALIQSFGSATIGVMATSLVTVIGIVALGFAPETKGHPLPA